MTENNALVAMQAKMVAEITGDDIRKYFCDKATEKEIYMALGVIRSLGLNPFKREVYLVKYGNNPLSIVVGYEVYLKRAERMKRLDGWSYAYDGKDESLSCTVTIHRKDWKEPFRHTAFWSEVVGTKEIYENSQKTGKYEVNRMWKSRPRFMLMKVAVAQAMRLCFPDEMGGLPYTEEEGDMIRREGHIIDAPAEKLTPPKELSEPKPEAAKPAPAQDAPPAEAPQDDGDGQEDVPNLAPVLALVDDNSAPVDVLAICTAAVAGKSTTGKDRTAFELADSRNTATITVTGLFPSVASGVALQFRAAKMFKGKYYAKSVEVVG